MKKMEITMYEIIMKEFNESDKKGYILIKRALDDVIKRITPTMTDDLIFNILEELIEEKEKIIKKEIRRSSQFFKSKIEILVFSQQLYNRYLCEYKNGYDRQLTYADYYDENKNFIDRLLGWFGFSV